MSCCSKGRNWRVGLGPILMAWLTKADAANNKVALLPADVAKVTITITNLGVVPAVIVLAETEIAVAVLFDPPLTGDIWTGTDPPHFNFKHQPDGANFILTRKLQVKYELKDGSDKLLSRVCFERPVLPC